MSAPKPSERFHWLHRQIAYNLVQLCVRLAACRRSEFPHKQHEAYAYMMALHTQRNTLHWLPERDRAAVIRQAKKDMHDERESKFHVATYALIRHDTPVLVNGRRTLWCHFICSQPGREAQALALEFLAHDRIVRDGQTLVEREAAQAVAA